MYMTMRGIERNSPVPQFQTNPFWGVESRRGVIRTSALTTRTDGFSTKNPLVTTEGQAEKTIKMAPEWWFHGIYHRKMVVSVRKVIRESPGMHGVSDMSTAVASQINFQGFIGQSQVMGPGVNYARTNG